MENNEQTPFGTVPETPAKKVSPFEDSPYVIAPQEPEPIREFNPQKPVSEPETPQPVVEAEIPQSNHAWTVEDLPPLEPRPKKKSSAKKVWKTIGLIAAGIGVLLTACSITAAAVTQYWRQYNIQSSELLADLQQQINKLEDKIEDNSYTGNGNSISGIAPSVEGLTPGQVYAQNHRSVVAISNQSSSTNIYGQVTETAGSGFIISEDGYIITNYHVVADSTKLTVITSNGTEYPAKLIGYDDRNDFALIKVEASGLPAVTLGKSDDLIVGDQVVAIGNPLGELTNSLTVGYISAKERDVTTDGSIINMLQTDAAINPGNSGGPLFNMKGEVIGIISAKYSGTTSSGASIEGIGFAIPIDDVIGMVNELIDNGFISAPYMGVSVSQRADGMGVYVESVEADSPAAAAGIKAGDIIVGIGEYSTASLSQLDKVLRNFSAHETTTISVYRNRQVLDLTITFAEKNQAPTAQPTQSELPEDGTAEEWYDWWLPNFGG